MGHFVPIPDTPTIDIVPGNPAIWKAVLPSLRRPGERFHFGLKSEDQWGNPTPLASATLQFKATLEVEGLPEIFDYPLGKRAVMFENLRVNEQGELRISVIERDTGTILAESHPMLSRQGQISGYWGDLHGQSGESIGIGTARSYFNSVSYTHLTLPTILLV